MDVPTKLDLYHAFDEAAYLERYPDIQRAIAEGVIPNAWTHFLRNGLKEGRSHVTFDEEFYLTSYPQAAIDIDAGRAETALGHYLAFGRAYGYLPNGRARRPDFPARIPSRFGGLWIDGADAVARVDGRLETGQINPAQAQLLHKFIRDGYVILENAIDDDTLDRALGVFDGGYSGAFPELQFECPAVGAPNPLHWQADINQHASKALDIHHFGRGIRDLIFAPKVMEFFALIFESKTLASQTLGFLRGSAQEGHQDSAYVPYSMGRNFAASWTALEDVTIGAGELFYWVGSHKLPDFLYDKEFKSASEANRIVGAPDYRTQIEAHVRSLETRAQEFGLRKEVFAAKKGDVLVWHADLVHGGNPVSQQITRKSVVTHFCPRYLVPLFAERMAPRYHEHDGHLYTTSYYRGIDPLEPEDARPAAELSSRVAATVLPPELEPVTLNSGTAPPGFAEISANGLAEMELFGRLISL